VRLEKNERGGIYTREDIEAFREHLKNEEKDEAIRMIVQLIQKKTPLRVIYEEWIIPAIINWECPFEAEACCIWREHILSATLKTGIELCYPLVMEEYEKRGSKGKSVFVFCPWEELHELGAKIIADLLHAYGFEVVYTGTNTPERALNEALKKRTPDYLAISVTNPYHLFQVQDLIKRVRLLAPKLRIIVGGQAIRRNTPSCDAIGADFYIYTMDDFNRFLDKEGVI
jgi:methanogenic corrinoid protein MtbC1